MSLKGHHRITPGRKQARQAEALLDAVAEAYIAAETLRDVPGEISQQIAAEAYRSLRASARVNPAGMSFEDMAELVEAAAVRLRAALRALDEV